MNMLIGFCLLTLVVYQVSALECYQCVSGCNDEFSSSGVSKVTCSGSCTKTKAKDQVVRGCIPIVKTDDCEEEGDAKVCLCTSDLCNGASVKYMSTFGLITVVACVILNTFKNIL